MRRAAIVVGLVVAGLALMTAPARAQSYFAETHYDVGIQEMSGVAFGGASASGTALHVTEHNGLVARMILAVPFMFGVLQVGGDQKINSSVTKGTEEYDVVGVDSHGVERSRERRTRETTTFNFTVETRSVSERAAQQRTREAVLGSYATLARLPMHFEISYLPDRDDGHLHGVQAAIYPLAISLGRHVEIAAGYAGTRLKIDVTDADGMRTVLHRARAIPIRLGFAPTRWLVLTTELHNNLLAAYGSTFRATAALSIPHVERFYAKLGTERIGLAHGPWSTFVEGGVRF